MTTSSALAAKKSRKTVTVRGKVSEMKHGRDKKRRHFWDYTVTTAKGEMVYVRDYKYGRYRQPASVGVAQGRRVKADGFYVNIRTESGSDETRKVLIIPGAK